MANQHGYHYNTEAPGAPQCLYATFAQVRGDYEFRRQPCVTCSNRLTKLEKDQAYATSSPEPSRCPDMEAAASELEQGCTEYTCASMQQRCHVCDKLLRDLVQGLQLHETGSESQGPTNQQSGGDQAAAAASGGDQAAAAASGLVNAPSEDSRSPVEDLSELSDDVFLDFQHPTGEFRKCPMSPLDAIFLRTPIKSRNSLECSTSPLSLLHPSPTSASRESRASVRSAIARMSVAGPVGVSTSSTSDPAHCPDLASTSRQLEFDAPGPAPQPAAEAAAHPSPPKRPAQSAAAVDEQDRVFGVDLNIVIAATCTAAPQLVIQCVTEIEEWCLANKTQALSVYTGHGIPQEVQEMKTFCNAGKEDKISTQTYDVHSIGALLKKYLIELPNPVIPFTMYQYFMDIFEQGKTQRGSRVLSTVGDVAAEIPTAHKNLLRYLLTHIARLIRWQSESDVSESFEKITHEFANIIIRPSWNRLSDIMENTKIHNDILQELLRGINWGDMTPPLPAPAQLQPKPPAPTADAKGFPPQNPLERLLDAPWYWGNVPKAQANDLMSQQPDGAFLVREASTPGQYTLMVRYENSTKLIRIVENDGYFGFVEPLEFPSVVTLVNWYQCTTLYNYNKSINTKLVYPVIRNLIPDTPSGSVAQELESFMKINQRYKKRRAQYEYLYEWYSWLAVDTLLKTQALDSLKDLMAMLREQIEACLRSPSVARASLDIHRFSAYREECQRCEATLVAKINDQQGKYRLINGELCISKAEIQTLHRQRDVYKNWLNDHGVSLSHLHKLMELDDSVWMAHCDRDGAEKLLSGKQDGTFLIRPKIEENIDVLSVLCRGKPTHCKILHNTDGNFGFSEKSMVFSSLKDIVEYHNHRSLSYHNPDLDVCLVFPLHMQEQTDA